MLDPFSSHGDAVLERAKVSTRVANSLLTEVKEGRRRGMGENDS
jgi:hypothetical protein